MGDVSITVSADTAGVNTGLARAQEAVNSFKEASQDAMKDIGGEMTKAFAVGAIIEGIKGISEEMERIQKLATRFGETAETMQRVSEAAKLNGTDLEAVAKAMTKVNSNSVEAINGNDKLSDSFAVLGLNAQTFIDMPMEEKLTALARGYEDGGNNAEKMAAVMKVLGKGAADLIPMFAQGSDALSEEFANASVVSNQSVEEIAKANETLTHSFNSLKVGAAESLAFVENSMTALGRAAAVVWAYISNLPHGLQAAKDAANEAREAAAEMYAEEDKAAAQGGKKPTDSEGDKIAAAKDAQDAKDAASKTEAANQKELGKLEAENAKKRRENAEEQMSLIQKSHALEKDLMDAEGRREWGENQGTTEGKVVAAKASGEMDEISKKYLDNNKEITRKENEAKEQATKEAWKKKLESDKDGIESEEALLKDAREKESALKDSIKHNSISVDNLRSIGGGYAGVNYGANALSTKEDSQKQALEVAKQQVRKLEQIVASLRKGEQRDARAETDALTSAAAGNGAFNLSS